MNASFLFGILVCWIGLTTGRPQNTDTDSNSESESLSARTSSGTSTRGSTGGSSGSISSGTSTRGSTGGSSGFISSGTSTRASTGGSSGAISVECGNREVSPGKFKFTCEELGRNADALTLKSEQVLWVQQDGGQAQTIDILVPNYRIDELIKAGFKEGTAGGSRLNILLKRPEQTYNAEINKSEVSNSVPSVAVQYESVDKVLVHYPNDRPYQPLSGPILPPA